MKTMELNLKLKIKEIKSRINGVNRVNWKFNEKYFFKVEIWVALIDLLFYFLSIVFHEDL